MALSMKSVALAWAMASGQARAGACSCWRQSFKEEQPLLRSMLLTIWPRLCPMRTVHNGRLRGSVRVLHPPVSGSGWWRRAFSPCGKALQLTATSHIRGPKPVVEKRWREFFSDPLQWWDHRLDKQNARFPDFKHKTKQVALWIDGQWTPAWVKTELAAIAPGTTHRSILSWNSRLDWFIKTGQYSKGLDFFQRMRQDGMEPNSFAFVRALNACASLEALEEGKRIHKEVVHSGYELDVVVGSGLVEMYAKCGSINDSWNVFEKMSTRSVVGWNAMISGYAKCGQGQKALDLTWQMLTAGVHPNQFTFVAALNACTVLLSLEEGTRIHDLIVRYRLEGDVFVSSSLVDMYAKCGSIEDSWRVFHSMPLRNVVSWNTMIQTCVKAGHGQMALQLYEQMRLDGQQPDRFTFVAVLNACAGEAALEEGRAVHNHIIERGCEPDNFVYSSLVDMYTKCGSAEEASRVFEQMPVKDLVSWNAMIVGHVKCGLGQRALGLAQRMEAECVKADTVTYMGVLSACASCEAIEEGKRIHERIIRNHLDDALSLQNSLIDMYSKCGSLEDARNVFNKMKKRDVISWNTMMQGYVKSGKGLEGLELSRLMLEDGVQPDPVTFVALLNACASVAALEEGRRVHERIIENGLESDMSVINCLIDMYAKCGSVEDAWKVFGNVRTTDLVTWNAMLGGLALHGLGNDARGLFEKMCQGGMRINEVTFVSLLSACSHAGLVDEGLHHFDVKTSIYNISTRVEHCACVVDLLSRAGRLHEAEDLIQTMRCEPNSKMLVALLSACRVHHNVEIGERVATQVLKLDPGNTAAYVLLSKIHAAAGNWDRCADVQRERLLKCAKKQPGCTWIEIDKEVHSFTADDQSHPRMDEIRAELARLSGLLKKEGYVPDTRFVLHDLSEDEKVVSLWNHSEKLAIALGLISSPPGTPLYLFKNLRVCGDCHTVTKFISRIVGRTIIARDANRFHRFEDGFCSCREYW